MSTPEMRLYQRACLVVATEGLSGLYRRIIRKWPFNKPATARDSNNANADAVLLDNAKKDYQQLVDSFAKRSAKYGDLSRYYWYHTIDLGDGLVTPGDYDYRQSLPHFQFPEDMRGMNVLDVGSATGFFAFEFEKRGANVISVELPSIAEWDMPFGDDKEQTLRALMAYHQVHTLQELHHVHLDGPFQFCRKILQSKVQRCYSTIYDLSPETLGTDSFDLIFVGDLLLHTFSPFKALCTLAPLCRGTLVITHPLPLVEQHLPVMLYVGGEERYPGLDNRTWFLPNKSCFEAMLKRLGFKSITVKGNNAGILRREWIFYNGAIIHAVKQ
jgi:tRNA (mo5U34)-methyltransferase